MIWHATGSSSESYSPRLLHSIRCTPRGEPLACIPHL